MTGAEADFYSQFNHSWLSSWAMAVELTALKIYWAYSLTGMHDLAMRQIIDGADALVSITSGPTKIEVSHVKRTANHVRCLFLTSIRECLVCTVMPLQFSLATLRFIDSLLCRDKRLTA